MRPKVLYLDGEIDWPTKYLVVAERVCLLVGWKYRGSIHVSRFVNVPNTAKDKTIRFEVRKSDVKLEEGELIVGVVHSHGLRGSDKASKTDLKGLPEGWIGVVFAPKNQIITFYDQQSELASFYLLGQKHCYRVSLPQSPTKKPRLLLTRSKK